MERFPTQAQSHHSRCTRTTLMLFVAGAVLLFAPNLAADSGSTGSQAEPARAGRRAAGPLVLVTAAELSALPSDVVVAATVRDDSGNGPVIQMDSPTNHATYSGPFPILIEFREGPLGIPVDMESLKLEYKKAWGFDITDRVRDYIQGTKIEVQESELPTGRHTIEILISDTAGNRSSKLFSVTIE